MDFEKIVREFLGQYIIVLSKFRRELLVRGYEDVFEKISEELLEKTLYLYCQYKMKDQIVPKNLIEQKLIEVLGPPIGGGGYSVQWISSLTWLYGREDDKQNQFWVLLLLCMRLEEVDRKKTMIDYYTYLVKLPVEVLTKKPKRKTINPALKLFKVEEGIKIVENFFEEYSFILAPIEYEEYRIDFVSIKSYYENIFYRFKFDVVQWGWNKI